MFSTTHGRPSVTLAHLEGYSQHTCPEAKRTEPGQTYMHLKLRQTAPLTLRPWGDVSLRSLASGGGWHSSGLSRSIRTLSVLTAVGLSYRPCLVGNRCQRGPCPDNHPARQDKIDCRGIAAGGLHRVCIQMETHRACISFSRTCSCSSCRT